jgi:hypothetical protein
MLDSIGHSLIEKGCADIAEGGMLDKSSRYVPKKESIDRIVEKIRAELLENGTISETTVALVSLLENSGYIKQYFSAYEKKRLITRLKEIKDHPASKIVTEMSDLLNQIALICAISAV